MVQFVRALQTVSYRDAVPSCSNNRHVAKTMPVGKQLPSTADQYCSIVKHACMCLRTPTFLIVVMSNHHHTLYAAETEQRLLLPREVYMLPLHMRPIRTVLISYHQTHKVHQLAYNTWQKGESDNVTFNLQICLLMYHQHSEMSRSSSPMCFGRGATTNQRCT